MKKSIVLLSNLICAAAFAQIGTTPIVTPLSGSGSTGTVTDSTSTLSTNAQLANALVGGGIFVSKAYGSDTNAAPGPFYTLSAAGSNAIAGQTIYVLDGTYYDYNLSFPGVNWYFADGTTVINTNGNTWLLTNQSLTVSGFGTFSNKVVGFTRCTNQSISIQAKTWVGATTSEPLFSSLVAGSSLSNRFSADFSDSVGKQGGGFMFGSTTASSETNFNEFLLSSAKLLAVNPITTGFPSNSIFTISAPVWHLAGNGTFNNSAVFICRVGRVDRIATTQATAINRAIWQGTYTLSTNNLSTAIITNARGLLIVGP